MTRLVLKVFAGALNPDGLIYSVFVAPNWLHYEIALFVIVILVMVVVSFFTEKPDLASIQGLYLGSATPEQKRITRESWNNWDLVNSAIVIIVVIAFYAYFW
jgi:SSS family solute:Na+ symporter